MISTYLEDPLKHLQTLIPIVIDNVQNIQKNVNILRKYYDNLQKNVTVSSSSGIMAIQDEINMQIKATTMILKKILNPYIKTERIERIRLEKIRDEFHDLVKEYGRLQIAIASTPPKNLKEHRSCTKEMNERTPLLGSIQPPGNPFDENVIQERKQSQALMADLEFERDLDAERLYKVEDLEAIILDVNQIFKDLGYMVKEQGETLETIESHVQSTNVQVESANSELQTASNTYNLHASSSYWSTLFTGEPLLTKNMYHPISDVRMTSVTIVSNLNSTKHSGGIKILWRSEWKYVCQDGWNDLNSEIACKQLGYKSGSRGNVNQTAPEEIDPDFSIINLKIMCDRNHKSLSECKTEYIGDCNTCDTPLSLASVTCTKHDTKRTTSKPRTKNQSCGVNKHTSKRSSAIPAGKGKRKKILNSKFSSRGEIPWQTQIRLYYGDGGSKAFCSAAILNENWLLTAAHCFDSFTPQSLPMAKVVMGDQLATNLYGQSKLYDIIAVKRHPKYEPQTYDNDIALIKVSPYLKMGPEVQPICLPHSYEERAKQTECQVAGWGIYQFDRFNRPQYPTSLRVANVKVLSDDFCNNLYMSKFNEKTMFCAGDHVKSIDTCSGDSGAPMTCSDKGVHYIHGIVSWGLPCSKSFTTIGVYTRVSTYVDWILNNTNS